MPLSTCVEFVVIADGSHSLKVFTLYNVVMPGYSKIADPCTLVETSSISVAVTSMYTSAAAA